MTTERTDPIDPLDAQLLTVLQRAVPVVRHPFAALGEPLGLSADEVRGRLTSLKDNGLIRQISAIFDTRSLGYASSLVAARVDPAGIDAAAAIINRHPGVSHNYRRNHDYNLWYTIAVSPNSALGLERTVARLHAQSGAQATRLLPTLKLFKIGVRFDIGPSNDATASNHDEPDIPRYSEQNRTRPEPLTAPEISFVRVMQRDLPLNSATPFVDYAAELGIPLAALQQMHEQFLASGRMRRFAAVLHHRRAGFGANAMGVWAAPTNDPAEIEKLGTLMAGFRAVSHCYRRPTYPDWPYNLFTMIHGKSPADCEATMAAIADKTGLADYHALYSSTEYKKVRVTYFTDAEQDWERQSA